jgi:hypothetical protein
MLDSTSTPILKVSVSPGARITGNYLAKNRLSDEARTAIALRLLRGDEPVTEFTVAQVARLCRVPRAKIDQHLGRHRTVGEALVKAFRRASAEERIAFIRSIGIERIWNVLTQAL